MALPTTGPDDQQLQTLLFTMQQIVQSLNALNKTLTAAPALASLLPTTSASSLGVYANDAAAAAAGVPLWGLYLNSTTFAVIARHV